MAFPLNPAQLAAVAHNTGPALVLAGAGSGKTRVITQRMGRLIEAGTPPKAITALTFTNKAAEEMRERLEGMIGHAAKDVWISTFHALGGEIVRREMPRGSSFVIYDGADSAGLVKEILRDYKGSDRRWEVGAIIARISHARNAMCEPGAMPLGPGVDIGGEDDGEADAGGEYDEVAAWVLPRYEAALQRLKALDFDDLILWPLKLLTEDASAREAWRRRIRFMLVDEFQDTNRAQLLLVKQLVGEAGNVFCVGDDDQSIYGWRGADISNVIDFSTHFPGAKVMALEQNYRSRKPVLDVANAVMEGQVRAFPKRLFTDRVGGDPVRIVECDSNEGEVKFVVSTIQTLITNGYKKREIGVLYRSNVLSRAMEEALRLANVPYRIIGGNSVYERREVKDLLAYLRLALHPSDEISLRRVINSPARGVGDATLSRLEKHALARGATLFNAVVNADAVPELPANVRESLAAFAKVLKATRVHLERGAPLAEVARQVIRAVGMKEDIIAAGPTAVAAGKRLGNLDALLRTMDKYEGKTAAEASTFITRLSLRFGDDEEEDTERVTLSTLHGSKGLEFGTVFFIGCDEGIIPHARTSAPKATDIQSTLDVGEERRLFYVGVTRAKEKLYLVRAKARSNRGPARATVGSRFLIIPGLPPGTMETVQYDSQAPLKPQEIAAQAKKFREALMALKGR
ncbi:MAG: 3'-5' exonuclease [Polyangiales bacterium]